MEDDKSLSDFFKLISEAKSEQNSNSVSETVRPKEETSLIQASLGVLKSKNQIIEQAPPTEFVTHEEMKTHYIGFLNSIQKQMSTIGGGGETRFRHLRDVNEDTMSGSTDNWVLEYDAESKTVKFTDEIGPISIVKFDVTHDTSTHQHLPGELCWSDEDETLNLFHPNGVVQQVGQEMYGYVRNNTGSTIPNGTAVRFSGAEQNGTARLEVAPMIANGTIPTLYGFGITTESLSDGADGRVTVWGKVRDVDTSAFSIGDILYVSPDSAGGLTNVKPTAPNNVIPMAAVLSVDSSEGELFVRPSYEQQKNYGSFSSDSNQQITLANTAQTVRINNTNFAQQLYVDSDDNIVANESGLYKFFSNFQIVSTNSSAKDVYFWIQVNDSDVPRTTRRATLTGNAVALDISALHNVSMNAGDKVKHRWAATDAAVRLDASAATAFAPSAPSVVIEVDQTAL